MEQENRICANCKKEFIIDEQDFAFYEKIKVPAPTWCPECRMIRKMLFRNERSLYKRICDLCKKDIFSMYPLGTSFPVYCHDCWWSDKWDSISYGRDYDWNKPFFEQFKKLYNSVPKISLIHYPPNENVIYSNLVRGGKNIYLSYSVSTVGSTGSEDIYYSYSTDGSKNCFDCSILQKSENCYENIEGAQNYNSYFLVRSRDCMDSIFLFDCVNCQKCFMCSNLRNAKYVFYNQQLNKEEYEEKLKNINLGSTKNLEIFKKEFSNTILKSIHKFANITKSVNCTGDDVINSKNVQYSFNVHDAESCKYFVRGFSLKDAMDVCVAPKGELNYESISTGLNSFKFLFSIFGYSDSREIYYSNDTSNVSNLFGCISFYNKQYCILNKQYTKQEYEEMVPKIIEHMNSMPYVDKKGRTYKYGEFFPPELSPFCYNETVAQEYFLLTKEQAIEQGYSWKDPEERNVKIQIPNDKLPDNIKDADDSIVGQIIECGHKGQCNEQCTSAFKIISQELELYRKTNLPLPRFCPNCRHYQRLKQRNPLKLWHRKCMCQGTFGGKASEKLAEDSSQDRVLDNTYSNTIGHFHGDKPCPNEFETSYAPDRPEIVYCEECYNMEVY